MYTSKFWKMYPYDWFCGPGGVLQKYPNFKLLSYVFGYHGNFS